MPQKSGNFWQDWVNLLLAVWLFISPWVLNYTGLGAAAWNAWIVAVVIGVIAVAALSQYARWEEWTNLVLGLWLVISPWVLAVAAPPVVYWNFVIIGLLIAVFAGWDLAVRREQPQVRT